MEEYLIDHNTLAKLVDELLSQKYPDKVPDNIDEIREGGIRRLDDEINANIFGSLNEDQLKELDNLLDNQEDDPAVFQDFFERAGISLNQKITEAAEKFSAEFLGGNND